MNEAARISAAAAAVYDAHAAPQAALADALAALVPPAERQGRAVELGAGTGYLTRRLQPWDGPYLATDASAAMRRIGALRCPDVAWAHHDARDPAGLGALDWVLSCNLLQWLAEPAAALRAWRRTLAPGGKLALGVLVRGTLEEWQTVLPDAAPVRWRSSDEWAKLMREAGFVVRQERVWTHTAHSASARDLLRELHRSGLAPRRLVGAGRLRTALRSYDQLFAETGGVRATWRGWLVRAQAA